MTTSLQTFVLHPDDFVWQRGHTPLSDARLVVAVPAAYVVSVLLLRSLLRGRTIAIGPLPIIHNAVLTVWSIIMFIGTLEAAWKHTAETGSTQWLLCLPLGTRVAGRLYYWSWIYYCSKVKARGAWISIKY